MGMVFPFPFTLEMGNDAARIFCLGSIHKAKLKDIDCREEWVRTLRNSDIMTPMHVDTELNDADLNTKTMPRGYQGDPLRRSATVVWWNTTFAMMSSQAAHNSAYAPHTYSKTMWLQPNAPSEKATLTCIIMSR